MILKALFVFSLFASRSLGQQKTGVHRTNFNSSFTLTKSQIEEAQLDDTLVENVQNIINFDRTQMAFGGPKEDAFYTLPPLSDESVQLTPGKLLKVQRVTDPAPFALPPNTALSRIMYTTTDFNGTVIPTTGFILWPYTPRVLDDSSDLTARPDGSTLKASALKASVVIWAHGTSGFFGSQSPSTHRGLWYDYSGPFALAQAGYAVFAPDYAGLGISASWDGSEIPHQYHALPATAGDALYGLRAAREAFPDQLDDRFVSMGHSQGGGVAWAIAEALANEGEFDDLAPGYKGSIAASPSTEVFGAPPAFIATKVALSLKSIFPSFQLDDWLTPLGVARTELLKEVEGGVGVLMQLHLMRDDIVKPGVNETWYAKAFSKLASAGRKDFKGPLLVIQGTDDTYVPYELTSKSVEDTSRMYPDRDIEFLVASGVGHVPVLDATKHLWLQWIEDRLSGKAVEKKGSVRTDIESFLPIEQYLSIVNSFPLWAGLPEYMYEVPLSV